MFQLWFRKNALGVQLRTPISLCIPSLTLF